MTEAEFQSFVREERAKARSHLNHLLGDWCEELGWHRYTYIELRRLAFKHKMKGIMDRFHEQAAEFKRVFAPTSITGRYVKWGPPNGSS